MVMVIKKFVCIFRRKINQFCFYGKYFLINQIKQQIKVLMLTLCLTSFSFSQQWEFMKGPYFSQVAVLDIHPQNPDIIYAGGGEFFKSTDRGQTWFSLSLEGRAVAVDPQNIQRVYASRFRSVDGGATWEFMPSLNIWEPWVLAVDPVNTNNIYAGDLLDAGIWKSTDYGDTWEPKNNGIPTGFPVGWIKSIAINPQNPSTIYTTVSRHGLYKTKNEGDNWVYLGFGFSEDVEIDWYDTSTVYLSDAGGIMKSVDDGQTWNYTGQPGTDITIDPIDHQTIYVGGFGMGIYKSENGGSSWQYIGQGLSWRSEDVFDIAVNPLNNNEVFIGTGVGIYISKDSSYQWEEHINALRKVTTWDFSIVDGLLYAATINGIYCYNGSEWVYKRLYTTMAVEANPDDPSILLATNENESLERNLYRSVDGGENWTWTGLTTANFLPISIAKSNPDIVYAWKWRSSDKGATWDTMSLAADYGPIAIDPEHSEIIYIAVGEGVFKSYDSGTSWDTLGFVNSPGYKTIAVDPTNGEVVYVSIDNEGIYKSTNGGYNWTSINTGLTNFRIRSIVISPDNSQQIYVGTNGGGVFYSDDRGINWTAINENLPSLSVAGLALDSSSLYVGFYEMESVYRREIITSIEEPGVSQKPVNFQLFQNYPNPFNSTTVIPFELGQSGHISIKVFNILGEEVITLLDKNLSAGRHSVSWNGRSSDGREVSSGLYFLKLETGNIIRSHKIMIIN